jgi:hypothetical protein
MAFRIFLMYDETGADNVKMPTKTTEFVYDYTTGKSTQQDIISLTDYLKVIMHFLSSVMDVKALYQIYINASAIIDNEVPIKKLSYLESITKEMVDSAKRETTKRITENKNLQTAL